MKTKVLLIATAAILAVGTALHIGHKPVDGKCPLRSAIAAEK